MKRLMYDYLISYTFQGEGFLTTCTGTIGISRRRKIKTFDDTKNVSEFIIGQIKGASNLAINNIMFIGRNRH